ncbi:MAG TPA: molybdenum cofactor biosynthesis protein MoaE [Acidimicrobiales bacterium]|nr:molybdenum cofactor biosynthesis protein MoaE [Acidimicrobiales bacterium]
MDAPISRDDWLALCDTPLPVAEVLAWADAPDCGGVVLFSGTVRDHSEGRPGVTGLEYEAYTELVVPKLAEVAAAARTRWPEIRRVAVLHRVGRLTIGDTAVVVVVGAPHREEAFAAARYLIDTVKATAPIWKRESWDGGASWVAS